MVAGLVVPAALLFVAWDASAGAWAVSAASILLSAVSGVIPAIAFARMPVLAGPGGVAVANGLFAQFGASGSMVGPPLLAACAGHWGWTAAAMVGAAASAACLVLMGLAERAHARSG
jgi:CP family cyanate transporter-like MFS transporter